MVARRGVLILVLVALQALHARGAPEAQGLQAYINPGRTVREQIAHMKKTWPQQLGVVVVEAAESPKPVEQDGVAYYFQEVRGIDWIFIRWFHPDPQAPGDRFKLHYWVRSKQGDRPLEAKRRGIAFIVPARAQGIFITEMVLVASRESIFEVRRVLIEAFP